MLDVLKHHRFQYDQGQPELVFVTVNCSSWGAATVTPA
jgi:hypothetical protein